MATYLIRHTPRLSGEVEVSTAKNAVLPILAAGLLTEDPLIIKEVPRITDVETLVSILRDCGAEVNRSGADLSVCALQPQSPQNEERMRKLRASILILGPILARTGSACVGLPGGCAIGQRPIDLHLKGLQALGAQVHPLGGMRQLSGRLTGARIYLDLPSVGATENLMMAASLARGCTTLENAAKEPEIVDLANCLNQMGARITGAGTGTVSIVGVERLHGAIYRPIPDRVEAGTLLCAAAITEGSVLVRGACAEHLRSLLFKLAETGVGIRETPAGIRLSGTAVSPFELRTLAYPGFPTDMQAPMTVVALKCHGTSLLNETVFENRFMHVSELCRLGGHIRVENNVALVEGGHPLCGGVVLCTTRMNKILSYDMNNLVVHIQPGVLLCDLAADALTHGLMYPPDPGEKTATVGGNVSTNAGGMRAVKYGVTRDYVLAMTVVLPDGRVMELGKTVCKTSSGYSLLHLMIGSEGTLGVITELTLKLIPKPEMNVSLILPFADVETAIASVPKIKLANLDPQSIEFMERDIVDSSAAFTGNTIFPTVVDGKEAGAYILVTLVGDSEAELTAKMDRLGALAEQCGAYDTLVVWTDGLKKDVWAARSAFLTVIEADTKLLDEMDVVVPVDRIAEFLVYTRATGKAEGITIRNFGHAGDGNLHIYCCANDMALDEFKRRSKAVMDKCYAKCIEFGGQVSGEHAIGHAKKQYLVESVGETAFGLMQAIKQVFDPKGILNPGKVCTNVEEG
mgnify:CR=1 FL=1